MRVTAAITAHARHDLLVLLTARMPDPIDALLASVLFCDEAERLFVRHAGPPPDAIVRRVRTGVWWLFAGGVWFRINLSEQVHWRWLFRTVHRHLFVDAVSATPPPAA